MLAMELRQLRSFLVLAAEGNFRRAAEKLHIVQPALTLQIKNLEEEIGAPLFFRTGKGAELTSVGVVFQLEAQRTVAQAERAREAAQKAMSGEVGTVRIGFVGNAVITGRLPADLKRFRDGYPHVALEVQELAPTLQARAIENGTIDLGYCHTHGSAYEFRLRTDVLAAWPWMLAMANDHPLARLNVIEAHTLQSQNFIVFGQANDEMVQLLTLQRLLGREPNHSHQVGNALTMLALAAAGIGIGLVPQPISTIPIPNLVFKPIEQPTEPTKLVLLSRGEERAQAVKCFRKSVLSSTAA